MDILLTATRAIASLAANATRDELAGYSATLDAISAATRAVARHVPTADLLVIDRAMDEAATAVGERIAGEDDAAPSPRQPNTDRMQSCNRIYDELALTVGTRLMELGMSLQAGHVEMLATDQDRDAGVDHACSLGWLVLDTGDFKAMGDAIEAQDDCIRSIMTKSAPNDDALATIQKRDFAEARARRDLMDGYVRNDHRAMTSAFGAIVAINAIGR